MATKNVVTQIVYDVTKGVKIEVKVKKKYQKFFKIFFVVKIGNFCPKFTKTDFLCFFSQFHE